MTCRLFGAKPIPECRFIVNYTTMNIFEWTLIHWGKCIWKCRLLNVDHFGLRIFMNTPHFDEIPWKLFQLFWGCFRNVYELFDLRRLKFSTLHKYIFQCMGKIFCVEFQRYPLKFPTKYLTHFLMLFILFRGSDLRALRLRARKHFEMVPWLQVRALSTCHMPKLHLELSRYIYCIGLLQARFRHIMTCWERTGRTVGVSVCAEGW